MIVYGDPAFTVSATEIARAFATTNEARTVEQLRDLLIAAGQIEQAVADSGQNSDAALALTDQTAEAFLAALRNEQAHLAPQPFTPSGPLHIKAPEGYAFYAVFPEQYVHATECWLKSERERGSVLVLGIRSIGTSLSAVIQARLRAAGVNAKRVTVRPAGHPFQRRVELKLSASEFQRAIVVDEGPGLSGSSIAAVVSALRAAGLNDVTIFPSHANGPGPKASEGIRQIWAETPKVVSPALSEHVRESWLYEPLKRRTEELLKSQVKEVCDLRAGAWRTLLGHPELAAVPQLERAKFLFRAENGRALLWKFAGLGYGPGFVRLSEQAFLRQRRMAKIGWSPLQIAAEHGFVATEWIDAPVATADDLTVERARHIARYILDAGKLPQPDEVQSNLDRLKEMAFCNVQEGLGAELGEPVMTLADRVKASEEMPCYGDGHLAPHEWLVHGARLIKTDVWGHDFDHTCIGTQSILWDVAGALLEWQMTGASEAAFCMELRTAGLLWTNEELAFYKAAYSAFRLGVATMFGDAAQAEHHRAALRYLVR